MSKITDESSAKQAESITGNVGNLIASTKEYGVNRILLVIAEAKLAITSVIMLLVIAIFAVILLTTLWALLCFGLANLLITNGMLSLSEAILLLLVVNSVALASIVLVANSLVKNLNFSNSLAPTESPETAVTAPTNPR